MMKEFPAIAIGGLKGVGKTVSSKKIANSVFELDRANDYDQLVNLPDILLSEKPPVLIDEWQRIPSIWDYIRRAVDDGAAPSSFLLTGSIANTNTDIHSGAGRIIRRKMYPLSLAERDIEKTTISIKDILNSDTPYGTKITGKTDIDFSKYIYEIAASGLPEIRLLSVESRKIAIESYFDNLLTHEFKQQGVSIRQPAVLLRWLRSFAAATATDAGYTEILDSSTGGEGHKPNMKTTIAYREALENLWVLDELMPWADGEDFFSGLKRSPKHFLADPALSVHLLGLDENILSGTKGWPTGAGRFDKKYGSILGRLFESLIHLSLNTYAAVNNSKLFFLKTRKGDHEINFIIQRGSKVIAIEVKIAPTITDSDVRHLKWFKDKVGDDCIDALIITTGKIAYRRKDGIAVIPAVLLGD